MKQNILVLWRRIRDLRIPLYAAHAGYFLILSIFPSLVLLLGLLQHTSLDIHSLLMFLEGFLPQPLLPEIELLIMDLYAAIPGPWLGISALTGLWSASRGIYGLLTGLNAVYGVPESRGYLRTRLLCTGYTFGFLLVLLLTLTLHVFGTDLLRLLQESSLPFFRFLTAVVDLRFFLLVFLQTALFTAMFMALPNRKNSLDSSLPGALLASIGWLLFSHLFSLYVSRFPGYAGIFGPVYSLALSMLWLYFCIGILFCGGFLNRLLQQEDFL